MKSAVRQGPIQLKISLLGSMRVQLGDIDVTREFRTKKERALFSYLAVESKRIHAREALAEFFWPERPNGYARTNLRQALSGIRRSILLQETAPPFLHISDEFVQFNSKSHYSLDCDVFDRMMREVKHHNHESVGSCDICASKLLNVLDVYRGEFLEELSVPDSYVFEEWVMFQREHYFRQLLTLLQHLITYHQNISDYKKAQEFAFRQVNLAPLEESAHRQLMTLLVQEGRRSAALEQYHTCRKILENELGVDPDIETTTLYEKIKSGQPLRTRTFHQKPVQTNLPTQFTRFVGRETEISWFLDCLDSGIYRFIAIVGMAGVGKTRLAIQVGSSLLNQFPDGIWFVPLTTANATGDIVPAIMNAIGIASNDKPPSDILKIYLKNKEALLIIDNFEHLVAGSDILFDLLRNAPKVILIVTSQLRMNYQAVSSLYLRGLPYPQDPAADDLLNYAAIKLFVSRANHSLPGFQIDAENAKHILRICKLVDGLPLGIELAAASIRNFNPQQIAEGLQKNLGILSTTLKDVPERHRSIRAAFSHSWNFLTDEEKDAYRKLSIFQGEFSLDAAYSTSGASLQVISSLADKSLIQINSSGYYSIQPLLRQFASEKLSEYVDSGESAIQEDDVGISIPTFDPITNLPNKVLFRYSFQNAISRARRTQQNVILMFVEIGTQASEKDQGKASLDDKTIQAFAKYLRRIIRESDILAHLVRGKFAILLEGFRYPNAGPIVRNKILKDIDSIDHLPRDISVNIGYSVYPEDSDSVAELWEIASGAINVPITQD